MSKKVAFVFPQVCKSWIQADVPDKNFTVLAMILKVFSLFSRSYHYVIIILKANFDSRAIVNEFVLCQYYAQVRNSTTV